MVEWILKRGRQKCGVRLKMVQERRRGWNKLWRCGDLLRNRCCVSHVYTVLCVCERERDEWESATRFTSLFPCTHCRQSRAEGTRWLARDDAGPWFCHAAVDTRAPTRRLPSLLRSLRARPPLLPSAHILHYTPVAVLLTFFFLIAKQVFVCLLGPRSLAQRERKKRRVYSTPLPPETACHLWRCELPGFLGGMSGRDNKTELHKETVWLLGDEMIQSHCCRRGSVCCRIPACWGVTSGSAERSIPVFTPSFFMKVSASLDNSQMPMLDCTRAQSETNYWRISYF